MNTKFSFTNGIRVVVVLAGLAAAAYSGQAALARSADRLPQANTPAILAPAADLSGAKAEAQPADDKGGLNSSHEVVTVEPGDDKGRGRVELGDDKGSVSAEPGDDNGGIGAESGDDNGIIEAEPGDDKGASQAELGDDKGLKDAEGAGGVEFTGTLSAQNGDVLTLNGITVILSATTEIKGTLKVGDMVKVEGSRSSDNTVQAMEIKIVSAQSDDNLSAMPAPMATEDGRGGGGSSSGSGSPRNDNPPSDNHGGNPGSDDPKGHH